MNGTSVSLRRMAISACFSIFFSLGMFGTNAMATGLGRAPDAASSALSAVFSCMDWRVVGLCFWLKCGWKGCKVKVSLKIRNYAPSAYTTSFVDTSALSVAGLSLIDSSGSIEARRRSGEARDHQTFRDADLYGHPLNAGAFMAAAGLGLVCPARTVPMFPYFESYLDAAVWRDVVTVESLYPASIIPGLREIGHFPTNTWGNLFPRTGRVVQQEEPKVGAVIAQRVGDIVTRTGQPHVYVPLSAVKSSSFGMKYWDPGPLVENDPSTGKWQMFHPVVDHSCYAFGQNDTAGMTSWSDGRRSADGEYAFNLWQPYTCCKDRGKFLFDINF